MTAVESRWRVGLPFVVMGGVAVVAGGLVAAVTGPLTIAQGSWIAAYLVLVVGVAQIVLGVGKAWLTADVAAAHRRTLLELIGWNLGSILVMAGTVVHQVWMVAAGSAVLLVALGSFAIAVSRPARTRHPRLAAGYLVWVLALFVSVGIGMTLSVLRKS